VLEFVTSCFDGEAVLVKEVGGLKADWEEKAWRAVQANHAGERDGVVRSDPIIVTLCKVELMCVF